MTRRPTPPVFSSRIVSAWLAAAALLAVASSAQAPAASAGIAPPPNAPAAVRIDAGRVVLTYAGRTIFEGAVAGDPAKMQTRSRVYRDGDRIEQVVYLFGGGRPSPKLEGVVRGGAESFACEADRRDRRGAGPLVVRHVSGRSRSLLNRAVYDRGSDWVLSVDAGPTAAVTPAGPEGESLDWRLTAEGSEIVLRFRPRFYQKHRGLAFYEPWTYKPWPHSVAGWISWFAFYADITEKDVVETAGVFAEALKPYGYDYFQIDDGYQQIQGAPEKWLVPNAKFPKGLKYLADVIKEKGLIPGLWTAASCLDEALPAAHPEWFVRDAAGKPVVGNWVGAVLDASIPAALDSVVTPLYKGLMDQGWRYIKLDALRHLRYEGYNANRDYFERKKADPVAAFRTYVRTVREAIGRGTFLLACWGLRPELIGLADACRIGDDGFAYAGLSQYNSFNNVVWRNDPDHIELDADGYRSTLVTTLTGSLMMLTDKPAVYRTAAIEPAKRTAPVLFTRPAQVYDVDPSRSALLGRVDSEVSGSGPRPFDAGYTPACHLYSLEIDRPYENWLVLGRTGGDFAEIRFADLGLDPARERYVFEFWSKRLLGSFTGGFAPGALDPKLRSQAFVIRERLGRPQVLATSRHVTGGGADLDDVRWDGKTLRGTSRGVVGDPYVVYLAVPDGFAFEKAEAAGAKVEKAEREGILLKITLAPASPAPFAWTARFAARVASALAFESSLPALDAAFAWAKAQALAYVFTGDPVGDWYEAALPRREAFCMRDVSHQAAGANALGLAAINKNLLRKFAVNISEAKDWCSYWEINRDDKPAPVDYRSDKEFWYNLPANFDVLDAIGRQYLWTGDRDYLNDPAFLNFGERTVTDYVARWDLAPERIMARPAVMHAAQPFDPKDPYKACRGLASYNEDESGMNVGADLPAAQYAGVKAQALLLRARGDAAGADAYEAKAAGLKAFFHKTWWDPAAGSYFLSHFPDGSFRHGVIQDFLLYFGVTAEGEPTRQAVRETASRKEINIEQRSYYPEILFRHGEDAAALRTILYLCDPATPRREYPEVSFAVIGALTTGLMGIAPDARDGSVATLPRLPGGLTQAEIRGVPVLGTVVAVAHEGAGRTRFTNAGTSPVVWKASFRGRRAALTVDGRREACAVTKAEDGGEVSFVRVTVAPGRTAEASTEGAR